MNKMKKGFTLIEMLVVILIIVILITIAVPAIAGYREEARETADLGDAKTLYTAVEATLTMFEGDILTDGMAFLSQLSGSNEVYTHQPLRPGVHGYSAQPIIQSISIYLDGAEYTGWYKFGVDSSTESVIWVSYHRGGVETSAPGVYIDRTAPDENVMLYHIQDGVSGYLDELGEPYSSEERYKHND